MVDRGRGRGQRTPLLGTSCQGNPCQGNPCLLPNPASNFAALQGSSSSPCPQPFLSPCSTATPHSHAPPHVTD